MGPADPCFLCVLSVFFDFSKGVWEINPITVMNVVGFRYTKILNSTVFLLWSLWGFEAKRSTFLIRDKYIGCNLGFNSETSGVSKITAIKSILLCIKNIKLKFNFEEIR